MMRYRIRAFLLALAVNALFIWALDYDLRHPPVRCHTDSECMAYGGDGGPETE